jgi:hypothetical protein
MATVMHLCKKALVLERGQVAFVGDCMSGVAQYTNACNALTGSVVDLTDHPRRRPGSKPVLGSVRLLNSAGQTTDQVLCGEGVAVELGVHPACTTGLLHFAVGFDDGLGTRLFTAATYLTDTELLADRTNQRVVCRLDLLPLAPGRYCLTLNGGPKHAVWTDVVDQALWFEVVPADFYRNGKLPRAEGGRFLIRSRWKSGTHL